MKNHFTLTKNSDNNLMFHTAEVDTAKIENFVKEGFESKLGKNNVLNIQFFTYPNEFIVAVTVRKENAESQKIVHELQEILLENNLPVAIYTKEAKDQNETRQRASPTVDNRDA